MKFYSTILIAVIIFYSCQKSPSAPGTVAPSSNCLLTRFTQGFNNDSIQKVTYDQQGKISEVTDSVSASYNRPVYDGSGRIVELLTNTRTTPVTIEYNAQGLPSKIIDNLDDIFNEHYAYEFGTNNLPSKKTWTSIDISGTATIYTITKYEYNAAGDISRAIDYDPADSLHSVHFTDYTYTNDANFLKNLVFFNGDVLYGYADIMTLDYYFNKHMVKTAIDYYQVSPNDKITLVNTYSYDSSNKITGIISTITSPFDPTLIVHTRNFYYDCK